MNVPLALLVDIRTAPRAELYEAIRSFNQAISKSSSRLTMSLLTQWIDALLLELAIREALGTRRLAT